MKTINISSVHGYNPWLRQFPNGIPEWDGWRFVFNDDENHYDYLVVFDDLHAPIVPKCPPENIIHIATEPPSCMMYNKKFLAQFAWILTLGNKNSKHPGAIPHQPSLTWHIGWRQSLERETDSSKIMSFEALKSLIDQPKSKLISIISSNLTGTTSHRARLKFAQKIKRHYGDRLDFYGRGFVQMDDKLEALQKYRFQIVLENSVHENYFSEKLTDCILAGTYPIYHGCPNLARYFPENSYLPININNFDESVAAIDNAITQQYDKKYRKEMREAQQRVLYEHNIYPMLIRLIEKIEVGEYGQSNVPIFYDKQVLPYRIEKDNLLFPPQLPLRRRVFWILYALANKYRFFDLLRHLYIKVRDTISQPIR